MSFHIFCKLLLISVLLALPIGTIFAKDKHCVLASNFIDGNNFFASTGNTFVHLSTTIGADPGTLLYVLPRDKVTQDQSKGIFYYIESMTSSCIGWTMTLRDNDGNDGLLIGDTPRSNKCRHNKDCEEFDVLIKWMPKDRHGYKLEKVHFKSTRSARLQGLDTSIPAREAEHIIAKTTYAVCSKVLATERDFEQSDIFRQCVADFSGQTYVDQHRK